MWEISEASGGVQCPEQGVRVVGFLRQPRRLALSVGGRSFLQFFRPFEYIDDDLQRVPRNKIPVF